MGRNGKIPVHTRLMGFAMVGNSFIELSPFKVVVNCQSDMKHVSQVKAVVATHRTFYVRAAETIAAT